MTGRPAVTVRHNFETAHRLLTPGRDSKCWNLHGHSFWTTVTVEAPALDGRGMVVEYGDFKARLRDWIDRHLDHGAALNERDPLVDVLAGDGCKVWLMPHDPTVEALAALIFREADLIVETITHADGAHVTRVHVQETHVNGAECLATN